MNTLVYKNEQSLFTIMMIISVIVWLALIVGTFGVALIYLMMFYVFYLFAQSALVSHLKGTGVKIAGSQFPDLHERIQVCCNKLGLPAAPDAYILQAGGAFNAFATRFRGRNFVVLFSDIVDALEDHPDALNFYIGHEIGHIKRNHLRWSPILAPASLLPLVGAAYARAREYTCDRHGLAACADPTSAQLGLAALAAGGKRWRTMNRPDYVAQSDETTGFWMSFHEYISDYPWLVKRMAALAAVASGREVQQPKRHPLAGLLALFIPHLGVAGGAGSLIVVVAIIGILAAIAIPQFSEYQNKARVAQAVAVGKQATVAVGDYYHANGSVPADLAQAGFAANVKNESVQEVAIDQANGVVTVSLASAPYVGKSIKFEPSLNSEKKLEWRCTSDEIPERVLPAACRAR